MVQLEEKAEQHARIEETLEDEEENRRENFAAESENEAIR